MRYIHQLDEWPGFWWDDSKVIDMLAQVCSAQGRILGYMQSVGFELCSATELDALTAEILKSSEIEGEILDLGQVRSSLARYLGINIGGLAEASRHIDGIVEMTLDATKKYEEPLTEQRLFAWHNCLFPAGTSGLRKLKPGQWRQDESGPMCVVSGSYGKERVHFEAPIAERVPNEISTFLNWFNDNNDINAILKAAVAHLWFVTIHPFDDGNGRIARAVADMQLARSDQSPMRFYSMSAQIRKERIEYYDILEKTQKSKKIYNASIDITGWICWFLKCLLSALENTDTLLSRVLKKAEFWSSKAADEFNERQRLMINKLFDGFTGKLTAQKWAKITKCSHDTALRDITQLIKKSILIKDPSGGRNTSYSFRNDSESIRKGV